MENKELIAAVASEENDDVYQSLIDEYGQEYLQEEQPDDQVLTLDDEASRLPVATTHLISSNVRSMVVATALNRIRSTPTTNTSI